MSYPTNKAELLAQIDRSWMAFNAAATVDESLVAVPGPDGWSVKDQLAHVSAWERILIALLSGESLGAAAGMDDAAYHASDDDEKNARLHDQHADLPMAEVRTRAAASHAALVEILERLTWDEINLPYSHFQRTFLPENDYPIWAWIRGMGYGHYETHQGYIEQTIAALQRERAAS